MCRLALISSLLVATCLGAPSLDGRIIGGRPAHIEDYPYQVSFEYFGTIACGAAIIAEEWVITAAHCVEDAEVDKLVFRAGSSIKETGGTVHEAIKFVQHPNFDYDAHDFDIAVVQVKQPFEFGPGVQAIPLATKEPVAGEIATVSGWGNTGPSNEAARQLQVIDFPVEDHAECAETYQSMVAVTKNMICAGFKTGGNDTCKGDSGGPMAVGGKLAGIVSFGAGCAVPGYAGIYTNVAALVDFITETTGVKV